MQLTWINAVFSRIALVSSFCAEIQLSGKIPENMPIIIFYPKTHGARRRSGEDPRGPTPGPSAGQARPRLGVVWPPPSASRPLLRTTCCLRPKNIRGFRRFPEKSSASPPPRETPIQPPETPFWHPAATGNWRRSSPSLSPTPLRQPSMIPDRKSVV